MRLPIASSRGQTFHIHEKQRRRGIPDNSSMVSIGMWLFVRYFLLTWSSKPFKIASFVWALRWLLLMLLREKSGVASLG